MNCHDHDWFDWFHLGYHIGHWFDSFEFIWHIFDTLFGEEFDHFDVFLRFVSLWRTSKQPWQIRPPVPVEVHELSRVQGRTRLHMVRDAKVSNVVTLVTFDVLTLHEGSEGCPWRWKLLLWAQGRNKSNSKTSLI
jgi:hypothetical protein